MCRFSIFDLQVFKSLIRATSTSTIRHPRSSKCTSPSILHLHQTWTSAISFLLADHHMHEQMHSALVMPLIYSQRHYHLCLALLPIILNHCVVVFFLAYIVVQVCHLNELVIRAFSWLMAYHLLHISYHSYWWTLVAVSIL